MTGLPSAAGMRKRRSLATCPDAAFTCCRSPSSTADLRFHKGGARLAQRERGGCRRLVARALLPHPGTNLFEELRNEDLLPASRLVHMPGLPVGVHHRQEPQPKIPGLLPRGCRMRLHCCDAFDCSSHLGRPRQVGALGCEGLLAAIGAEAPRPSRSVYRGNFPVAPWICTPVRTELGCSRLAATAFPMRPLANRAAEDVRRQPVPDCFAPRAKTHCSAPALVARDEGLCQPWPLPQGLALSRLPSAAGVCTRLVSAR